AGFVGEAGAYLVFLDPRASAEILGPHLWRCQPFDTFVGVWILPGDEDDVTEVLARIPPSKKGLGAHVMVDESTTVAALGNVGQRAVEEISVEDHHRSRRHLDRNLVVVGVGKADGLVS